MEKQINNKEIVERLIKLQADVDFLIQSRKIDEDCILSDDDLEALRKADEEYKNGELVSLKEIKKLREQNVRD